jgi:hypothetical protein
MRVNNLKMINIPRNIMSRSTLKVPPFVKVVKQRPIRGQRSIWCNPEHTDKIYSSMFNEKQFIYSFLTAESSKRCFQFLKKYNEVNGHYPDLHGKRIIKDNSGETAIYIDDECLSTLKRKCLLSGIGLIGISHFDYTYIDSFLGQKNVFNLSISAIDLLENASMENAEQIEYLNYLLDF